MECVKCKNTGIYFSEIFSEIYCKEHENDYLLRVENMTKQNEVYNNYSKKEQYRICISPICLTNEIFLINTYKCSNNKYCKTCREDKNTDLIENIKIKNMINKAYKLFPNKSGYKICKGKKCKYRDECIRKNELEKLFLPETEFKRICCSKCKTG